MGNVLHASYSGYFPFCIEDGDSSQVGPGTFHPISIPIEDIIKIYWRIRKINAAGPVFDPIGEADVQYFESDLFSLSTPNLEEEIVCNKYGAFFSCSEIVVMGQIFDAINIEFCSISLTDSHILRVGNLYYPSIICSGTGATNNGNTVYFGLSFLSPGWTQVGDIDFFGYSIPLYKDPTTSELPYYGSIYATQYWSYGETWDTTTGARL